MGVDKLKKIDKKNLKKNEKKSESKQVNTLTP
jgi:hypothetical protein